MTAPDDDSKSDGDEFLGFHVKPKEPELAENITLMCSASKYAYENTVRWYRGSINESNSINDSTGNTDELGDNGVIFYRSTLLV